MEKLKTYADVRAAQADVRAARAQLDQLHRTVTAARERNMELERQLSDRCLIGEELNQFTVILQGLVDRLRRL